jgi:hypothetical protein
MKLVGFIYIRWSILMLQIDAVSMCKRMESASDAALTPNSAHRAKSISSSSAISARCKTLNQRALDALRAPFSRAHF